VRPKPKCQRGILPSWGPHRCRFTHKLPKYSLHKPSGQARVKHGGKCYYLGKHGSQESHEAYARFVANLPKPVDVTIVAGASLLVGEAVLKYLAHCQGYYVRDGVPTGEATTIKSALRPLVKRFATLPVDEFGPRRLKEVREDMIELGWTRYTINRSIGRIKQCFTWCASEELIPGAIAVALSTVKGLQKNRTAAREKDPVGSVADELVDATLPHVSELAADVIRTMRLCGGRPGEIVTMTADQIDRTDGSCWKYVPGRHKCSHKDKDRVVFIGARAQEIILPRIVRAGADGRLFPITPDSLRQAIHRGCRRAGIPAWNPNMVRHTYASDVRKDHGLEAAQVLLGHSKANTTQVYAEANMRLAAEIARKIG